MPRPAHAAHGGVVVRVARRRAERRQPQRGGEREDARPGPPPPRRRRAAAGRAAPAGRRAPPRTERSASRGRGAPARRRTPLRAQLGAQRRQLAERPQDHRGFATGGSPARRGGGARRARRTARPPAPRATSSSVATIAPSAAQWQRCTGSRPHELERAVHVAHPDRTPAHEHVPRGCVRQPVRRGRRGRCGSRRRGRGDGAAAGTAPSSLISNCRSASVRNTHSSRAAATPVRSAAP